MTRQRRQLATELITVFACCAFFFFYGLGSFGLVGADEPRYAQIAREMLARHDWVTPVLNEIAWLEKPVLYYWGAMVSYSIFGVHDWAARIPTAVMTSLMVLAAYFFMRRFRPGSQLDAALIMASLAAVIGFGRAASTDMPLASMFAIGMLNWYAWYETRQRRWLMGFYFFMALATLAKGPVAPFLAGLIIVVFTILRREWKLILHTLDIFGLALYLVVALPWFILVQHANPQFLRVFIFEHNLERYGSDVFRHHQPFWYFGPVLLVGLLPWMVFAISSFVRSVRDYRTSRFELFFMLWAALPVIFFSFSGSKLPGYILPAIPAFAILTAHYLWRRTGESDQLRIWMPALHSLFGGVLLGGALLTNYFVLKLKPTPTALWIAVVVGLICCCGMMAAIYGKGMRMLRFATLVPLALGLAFVIKFATPSIDAKDSCRPVAQRIGELMGSRPGIAVAVLEVPRQIEYGLNFYQNQAISRYERGEIPVGEHVVVGRPGAAEMVASYSKRKVTDLGYFAAQGLEFYFVPGT